MAKKHNNTRNFSSADSVLYNGALYPSSTVLMDNGHGIVKDSKIFMDNDGQYYTMGDNGMAYPVMLQHELPEVEVKPSQEEMLSRSLRNSLTLSQDKARVSNPLNPYESFNTHLRERALRGASEHALWDKEHPNLASWRDFATAIPFGVASIPLAGGLGETALGQATLNGLGRVMSHPIAEAANSVLGLGMVASAAQDLKQGKFTPMTLLDLSGAILPAYGISKATDRLVDRVVDRAVRAQSLSNRVRELSTLDDVPAIATEEVPSLGIVSAPRQPWELPTEPLTLSREIRSLPSPELPPNALYNPMENMSAADIQTGFQGGNATTGVTNNRLSNNLGKNDLITLKPRDINKGEQPYTEDEINALINEDGTLKEGIKFRGNVRTGMHGVTSWYSYGQSPTDILQNHLRSIDPAVSRREMQSIMRANPQGRSGILIKTHDGDTSIDSTPLAYKMATRLGTRFKPLAGAEDGDRIRSNGFGINTYFKESGEEANRARALFKSNPNAEATLIRDTNGNITGMQLTDANGDFIIPLRSRQEVLDIMNKQLHNFNKHYGTSYSDIVPSNYDFNGNLRPWDFGEEFDMPNIYGISYKKGGKLCKRRGLTF